MCNLLNPLGQVEISIQKLLVSEEAFRVSIVFVLIFILCLAQSLHQLGMVLAFQVRLVLRFKTGHLLLFFLVDTMNESKIADGSFDDCAILREGLISKRKQVLERLECEFAHRVLVVVVVVLHHVLSVKLHIFQLLKCFPIVLVDEMSASSHLLKPHGLVVMDANIITTILDEDVHDSRAELNVAVLQSVHSGDGIDGAIGLVKISSFLMQLCGLLSVA